MNLISKNDNFVVFGSNGMAGSAICRALKRKGYEKILQPSRNELDLVNYSEVKKWFYTNKPNVVVIAAAKVGGIYANSKYPVEFLLQNLKIQNNIIEIASKENVKKLLFLGSSCIYPKFSKQPITEEELLTGSLEASNECYALAKIAGIKLCEALKKQYNFNAISLMPTNLYGPGDNYHPTNSHVLPSLIRRFVNAKDKKQETVTCWGTGSPLREFLHVDDLGNACVFVLEKWDLDQESAPKYLDGTPVPFLNVGTGVDISIKCLANLIANLVKYDGEIIWDISKPDGTPQKLLEVSRLKSLGWSANIPLVKGLEQTINIYKEKHIKISKD